MEYEVRDKWYHSQGGVSLGDRYTDRKRRDMTRRPELNMTPKEIRKKDIRGIIQRAVNEGVTIDNLALREKGNEREKLLEEIRALLDKTRALAALVAKEGEGPSENIPERFTQVLGKSKSEPKRRPLDHAATYFSEKYELRQQVVDGKWTTVAHRLIATRNSATDDFKPVLEEQPWQKGSLQG